MYIFPLLLHQPAHRPLDFADVSMANRATARMAKLVDAWDLKSPARKGVPVRFRLRAPSKIKGLRAKANANPCSFLLLEIAAEMESKPAGIFKRKPLHWVSRSFNHGEVTSENNRNDESVGLDEQQR